MTCAVFDVSKFDSRIAPLYLYDCKYLFWRKYPVFYTGYVRKKNTSLVSIAQALLRMELDGVYKCDRIFLYYKMYLRQMTEQV